MTPDIAVADWRFDAIEELAAAFYRATGYRNGQINPRWEFTDPVIQAAYRAAAQRYIEGRELHAPRLRLEPRYGPDGTRLNDEWVER